MRIAVWHNLPSGGGKRALVDHVDGLIARGHDVEVWTNPAAVAEPPRFAGALVEHVVPLEIDPGRGGALPPWPVVRRRLAAMSDHLDRVAAEIDAGSFDVVFGGACRYLRVVDLGRRVSAPSVLYLGEPYRWLYEALPRLPWALEARRSDEGLGAWGRRRIRDAATIPGLRRQVAAETDAAAGWDRLLVNSLYSRESVRRVYGLESRVCYLGIDPARLDAAPRDRERFVLGLGAFVPEKGVDRALRAVAGLSEPAPLVWVANTVAPPFRTAMMSLADRLGVELDVRVAISDSGLADLLATAGVLVYAPYLEPFGLAVLEASAAGLPVVGLAEAGVRETVLDDVNGLLVVDEAELAAGLDHVLSDMGLAERLGAGGRKLVGERWTLDAAIDRIEAELSAAATGGRP